MISVRIFLAALLPLALCLTPEQLTQLALHELSAQETPELSRLRENKEVYASFLTNLTAFAKQELTVAKEASVFLKQFQGCDNGTIEEFLSKYYSAERILQIKNSFKRITFRVNFLEDNGNQMVRFTRYGKDVFPPRKLATLKDVKDISKMQIASIVVESVELVLNAIGVKFRLNPEEEAAVIANIIKRIEKDKKMKKYIEALAKAAEGMEMARKIFDIIKETYDAGYFWYLVSEICKNMTFFDWFKSILLITATIVASFVTDGAALILKIALALKDAIQFTTKIASMAYLASLEQSFECQQN